MLTVSTFSLWKIWTTLPSESITKTKSLEVAKEELDFIREDRQAVLVKGIVQWCEIYKELYCEKETDARLK